jgi:hypothetical protein
MRSEWMGYLSAQLSVPSLVYTAQAMMVLEVMRRLINWQDRHQLMDSSVCTRETFSKGLLISSKKLRMKITTTVNYTVYSRRITGVGVREGEGMQSILKGKTKRVYNQLMTSTLSLATLRLSAGEEG